jgi:hypothetical protein
LRIITGAYLDAQARFQLAVAEETGLENLVKCGEMPSSAKEREADESIDVHLERWPCDGTDAGLPGILGKQLP